MLLKELKKIILKKELITLRRSCADDDLTGTIIDANENIVIMCLWSDEGDFEGITVFEIDQIDEVLWGNREHQAITHLMEKAGSVPSFNLKSQDLESAIFELFSQYEYLCIYHESGEDSFDICSLVENDGVWLKILTYGPMRTLSRLNKLVKLEDFLRVTVDSPYQNGIVELHSTKL